MPDTHGEVVESNCPFCDPKQFEERLIAEIDGFYIIATLGQITNGGYVLLFPVEHTLCMGALSKEQFSKALHLSERICTVLVREFKLRVSLRRFLAFPVTIFEHGIVGQTVKHAHLHFLPLVLDLFPRIKDDFPKSKIEELKTMGGLKKAYDEKPGPYLFWKNEELDDCSRICWDPPAPSQYLRTIAAGLLGRPERANWRTMNPELDRHLWSNTVRRLKPYFV